MSENSKQARITYLFGAGASIGNSYETGAEIVKSSRKDDLLSLLPKINYGIPITNQLNTYRQFFGDILKYTGNGILMSTLDSKILRSLKTLFDKDLLAGFTSQLSPDTHARVLKTAGRLQDYEDFKLSLSLYMSLLEGLVQIDPRYSNLFANFIDIESGQIPENLNFLTYNFDASPERTWLTFQKPKEADSLSIADIKFRYGIISSSENADNLKTVKSVFIKLHGSAGEIVHNEKRQYLLDFDKSSSSYETIHLRSPHSPFENEERLIAGMQVQTLDSVANIYSKSITAQDGYKSGIRFAWDIDKKDALIEKAQDILQKTDVLVICGYTFPAFNLANDLKLLEAFGSKYESKRIVIQLPENSINEVKDRVAEMIKSLNVRCEVETFQNCSSFHIPIEYFRIQRKSSIPGSIKS